MVFVPSPRYRQRLVGPDRAPASIAPYAAITTMLTRSIPGDEGNRASASTQSPGYFKTELSAALAADQTFSEWLVG
jgi:gluconate 5-dehydrogenase